MNSLQINGMSCQHCVASVKKALEAIDGIDQVTVDLETKQATFHNSGVAEEDLRAAINAIGFEPRDYR